MNSVYKERVGMVVIARVAMVALVLLCIAPRKLEAETPALAAGDGALSPAALSAEDWSAIQANLAQAADYAPLVADQVAKLIAGDAAMYDWFGWSVAISGDTVVVGAPHDTHSSETQAGSVYVFKRNYDYYNPTVPQADNWGLVRNLTASDAAAWSYFGHAVAISGDQFVVGAPGDDTDTGAAYVFERNHDGWEDWGEVEKLTADDGGENDHFGHAVAISGDTVVVGAYEEDGGLGDPLPGAGAAYVFERNQGGADSWGQVQKLTADDAAEDDQFGWSMGISGNTVVVGAHWDDDGGGGSGSTYVFRWGAAGVYLPLILKNSP